MNRLAALVLVSFALMAQPSWAATALDAARASANQARTQAVDVRARQMAMRQELNELAQRIETLKAKQRRSLLPGGELDTSLKRSQELSGLLSDAARQLSQAEASAQRENTALLSALSQSLADLKGRWDRAQSRDERKELVRQLRALRAERGQVRAQLPAAAVPALEASASDDPEELLEQADALRDSEDKVRQQMQTLKTHIAELREEHELDRRMSDFLGEEAIFDEQDRRLRGTSNELGSTKTADQNGSQVPNMAGASGGANPAPPPNTPSQTFHAEDARPVVGGVTHAPAPDDLKGLESQLQQMDSMARELERRAHQAEARAHELE